MTSENAAQEPSQRPNRRRPSRAEKAIQTRAALMRAAELAVGEKGYEGASVADITAKAEVGSGTFYNYFESRQDLFDQLLPKVGREMLEFIQQRSARGKDEFEREELRLHAFFAFLEIRPEFYRILYEAEVFAPAAFRAHMATVTKGYTRLLSKARQTGELQNRSDDELEVISIMLLGIRHYLCMNYARRDGGTVQPSTSVISAYMRLIRNGLGTPRTGA